MSDVCLICNQKKATKTNSHIVPSFLITSFSSYNSSGKRDSEVLLQYQAQLIVYILVDLYLTLKLKICLIKISLHKNGLMRNFQRIRLQKISYSVLNVKRGFLYFWSHLMLIL